MVQRLLSKIWMSTRVFKSWFIVELYKYIPPLFSLFLKMLEICFFSFVLLLTFNVTGKNVEKASFYTSKTQFSLLSIQQKIGVLLLPHHPLCRSVYMDSKKTKNFKILNIRDIRNIQHRYSPNQKLYSYNCNIIFSFRADVQIYQS